MLDRRTVGLAIPCQVASPRSLTPFRQTAKTLMPLGLMQPLLGVQFDSAAKICNITCPKLFIHGDRDEVVPIRLGGKLYDLAPPPKEFYEVPGAGHNDLVWAASSEYAKRLRDFLSHLGP